MAQQTEHRAVINGQHYVGFEVPGQFITIYRADDEFKALTDDFEGVWTIRSEMLRWGTRHTLNEVEVRQHFVKREGNAITDHVSAPETHNRLGALLHALFRDFTIPPMSIFSLILAAFMLVVGVLILIDAPELGPLLGGLVFGSAVLLVLFAIVGPFLW